ncbi:LCP family protein [Streptomyces sp. NPDC091266]|uniref:LCP family protein n=1 Tax=Streptomyces sp. NPDC091266 TaxID=3365978 RepID=UPI003802D470
MGQPRQPSPSPSPSTTTLYRAGRTPWWRKRRGPGGARPRPRWSWRRRILVALLVLVVLVVAGGVGLYVWAGRQVRHVDALGDYAGRPAAGKGTNWLLVGSDSRAQLTPAQRKELHVGKDVGRRTDTIMVLHSGDNGPYLVSLPRDSYLPIPGHGKGKINEAYADGGPKLLTRTVEEATGLRVDHYGEVNFLGLVQVVDALGGVELCVDKPIKDEKSGADFAAGCREMNGTQALAYVRARYSDPAGDLGRVKRQRQLISAVSAEMLGPGVLLNPFRLVPVLDASLSALTVENGAGVGDLVGLGWSMKDVSGAGGTATTVPVSTPGVTIAGAGDVLLWDETRASRLFRALRDDDPIPTSGTN